MDSFFGLELFEGS